MLKIKHSRTEILDCVLREPRSPAQSHGSMRAVRAAPSPSRCICSQTTTLWAAVTGSAGTQMKVLHISSSCLQHTSFSILLPVLSLTNLLVCEIFCPLPTNCLATVKSLKKKCYHTLLTFLIHP